MQRRADADAPALGGAFWRLWVGSAGSAFGDGLVFVAFPLLALTLTRRPLLVAGVAIAGQLPAALLSPIAGAVADRYNRRLVATTTEVIRLVAFAFFGIDVALGHDALWLIYLTVAVVGCCQVLFVACTTAVLPLLVPPASLERANGHLEAGLLGGQDLAGQGLGGIALALARPLPFLVDAASFLLSAILVRSFVPDEAPRVPSTRLSDDIADGFRWFARQPILRLLVAVIGTYAFCQSAVAAVLVLYVTGPLHAGRAGFGILLAVGSIGALAGAVGAARLVGRLGALPTIVVGGVLAACAYLLLAAVTSPVAAGVALAAESAGITVGNIASISLRQRVIPNELLGRVGTSFRMVLMGTTVLGAAAGGVVASAFGVRTGFVLAGSLQLVVIAAGSSRLRRRAGDGAITPVAAGGQAAR